MSVFSMKIYYACSMHDPIPYKDYYVAVPKLIRELGHVVQRDWVEQAIDVIEKKVLRPDRNEVFKEVMQAVRDADLCIFDVSQPSIGMGYQLADAVNHRIPCLIIGNNHAKETPGQLFFSGASSTYITIRGYDSLDDMKKVVTNYIKKNEGRKKKRINLALDSTIMSHLERQALLKNTSKTDIIQTLIEQDIQSADHVSGN